MPLLISTKDVGLSTDLISKLAKLGIQVSTFDDLIELIVETASKPQETEVVSAATLPSEARTYGLGGGSSQAVKITDKTFHWSSNGDFLTYDISNIKSSLGHGITYISTNVSLTGKGRTASRASSGSIALPENVTQATVSVNLQTEFGALILKKTFPVTASSSGSVVLDTDDQSAAPTNLTVSEHLDLLSAKISQLESQK